MSLAGLIKETFLQGGPFFMTLHLIFWILVIYFTLKFIRNYYSENRDLKKLYKFNFAIISIGSFGLLFAIFYQLLGFYGALSVIEKAQDISPALILQGLRISLIAPIFSFFLFLVTIIIWFIYKNKVRTII